MSLAPELIRRVREIITDDPSTWEIAWEQNVTPWDSGHVQPPLKDLIQSGENEFARTGRALVPGCGRGNDAIHIASTLGLKTLAIDISPTALKAADELLASLAPIPAGEVSFQKADFFSLQVPDDEKFDLVYDYTFFVAIPPSRRNEWGRQMSNLVKPGGYLIAIVYPMLPYTTEGPPFYIRPEHYLEPLGDGWVKVVDKVPENSLEAQVGKNWILVWKKL